jgi:hypothetical protein
MAILINTNRAVRARAALLLALPFAASLACTSFRQHSDTSVDAGGPGGITTKGPGGQAGTGTGAAASGGGGQVAGIGGHAGGLGGSGGTAPGVAGGIGQAGASGTAGSPTTGAAGQAGTSGSGGTGGQGAVGGRGGAVAGPDGAAGSPSDAGTLDAPSDTGPTTKPQGATCAADSECALGHCVDRVCCNTGCGATCMSCLTANTGQPDGTCATVKAGTAHGADCATSNSTTCGLDGKCDGAGACRRYAAGTNCGAESCTDGAATSMYTSGRTCDGHGTCLAATTSTCGAAYRCNGTKCRTTCGGAADCIASAYCSNSTCVAKKPDGQPCASATECSTGVCGGRCCAAGCTCTLPSPANLLKDPGVDVDVSNWTTSLGSVTRSLHDTQACPYSGSIQVNSDAQAVITQCVRNTPLIGDFNFGGRFTFESDGDPATALCQANFFSGFNCDGDLIVANETDTPTGGTWQAMSGVVPGVRGANSVGLSCYLFDAKKGITYYLDMLYISKAPGAY